MTIATKIQGLVLCFISIFALTCPQACFADQFLARGSYESAYQQLLGRRQRFMDDRSITFRNLNQCNSWIVQIDKALATYSPLLDRPRLMTTRAYLLNLRDKLRKDLDYQESSLLALQKDLIWMEAEMKHLACVK